MPKTKKTKARTASAASQDRVIEIRLPADVMSVLGEAEKVSGLTLSQLVNAMLALRLVTLQKTQPLTAVAPVSVLKPRRAKR